MRVFNKTEYRTDDLKKFFRAGIRALSASPKLWIHVYPTRGNPRTHGRAGFNSNWVEMWIPRSEDLRGLPFDLATIARIFEHELYHHMGVEHKDMTEEVNYAMGELPKWAQGLPIRPKPTKSAPSVEDKVMGKLIHARDLLKTWETKSRRVATGLKKWKRRVRYYERSLVQLAGPKKKKNGR